METSYKTPIRDSKNSDPRALPSNAAQEGQLLKYFLLVFGITIPFWVFGGSALPIPLKLPVSTFAAFNPMIAALILTYHQSGLDGVKGLFKKVFDFKKITRKAWYIPTLVLSPLAYALAYASLRWTGAALPDAEIPLLMTPVLIAVFFIFGIGEELGWMGYAIDPLQNRYGALKASILLGLVWAVYHLIPDLQNHQAADWILWQRLGTVLLRILMVWIYNNTGKSVFAVILFHVMINLSWAWFPNYGSHYDPFFTSLYLGIAAVVVIAGWDAQTLTRWRFARR